MEEDVLIEMHELRKDFNMTNNIYGLTNLREKLNDDKSRMMPTKRLLVPMFDFNLDRFN